MDILSLPPIAFLLDTARSALVWGIGVLDPITGGASAAVVVILLTLAVRAALIPTAVAQAKAEQTRARLAPKVRALQRRYKNDRERLQRELARIYQQENASPLAGCLPLLIQAPILGLVYSLFVAAAIGGHPNDLLTETFLGVPLGVSLAGAVTHDAADATTILVFGVIALLIAAVGEVTRRTIRPAGPPSAEGELGAGGVLASGGFVRAMGLLQFVTAVIALFVPLAAAVYLLVTVSWTLVQRLLLRRLYPAHAAPGGS